MTAVSAERVHAALRDAFRIVLEVDADAVHRDARLVEDLAADSLAIVEIVELLEERITPDAAGFHVDDEDLDAMTTVGDLLDYAVARAAGRPR